MWPIIQSTAYSWGTLADSLSPSTISSLGSSFFIHHYAYSFCWHRRILHSFPVHSVVLCTSRCVLSRSLRLRCMLSLCILISSIPRCMVTSSVPCSRLASSVLRCVLASSVQRFLPWRFDFFVLFFIVVYYVLSHWGFRMYVRWHLILSQFVVYYILLLCVCRMYVLSHCVRR